MAVRTMSNQRENIVSLPAKKKWLARVVLTTLKPVPTVRQVPNMEKVGWGNIPGPHEEDKGSSQLGQTHWYQIDPSCMFL